MKCMNDGTTFAVFAHSSMTESHNINKHFKNYFSCLSSNKSLLAFFGYLGKKILLLEPNIFSLVLQSILLVQS